jgi:hypothetical protein
MKNKAAQSLGRLAAGVTKKYSAEEIEKRSRRLAAARALTKYPPTRCACGKPVGAGVGNGLCLDCQFAPMLAKPVRLIACPKCGHQIEVRDR